jgi:putative transposase
MTAWISNKSTNDFRSFEEWERAVNVALTERPARLSMVSACHVLGLNRSTVAARRKRAANAEPARRSRQHAVQPRALSKLERAVVVEILHSEEYCS